MNGLDRVPDEIFANILRLLPPKTFYSIVPRVCRKWQSIATSALPGNNGQVALQADISFLKSRHPPYMSMHRAGLFDGFRCERCPYSKSPKPIWIAGTLALDVSVAFLEKISEDPVADFTQEVESILGRGWHGRLYLTFAEVGLDDNPLARRERHDTIRRLKTFCRLAKPATLDLDSNFPSWLDGGEERGPMPSVTEIHISLDKSTDSLCKTLPALFRAFPNLHSLTTWWTRIGDTTEVLQRSLPLTLRSQLRKIDISLKEGKEEETFNLLRILSVFPAVRDFGTFCLLENLWKQCSDVGIDLNSLSSVTTLRVQGRSHDVAMVSGVSSLRALADGFAKYMPGLRTLNICFFFSSNEELGTELEYVGGVESEDITDLFIGWSYLIRTIPAVTIVLELIEAPSVVRQRRLSQFLSRLEDACKACKKDVVRVFSNDSV